MQSHHINQPIVVWLLSDWQPKFTIRSLSVTLVIFSLICAIIAAIVFTESNRIVQIVLRYDDKCNQTSCILSQTINETMNGPIALYYRLTDFNQNTRSYSSAYSTSQVQSDDQTSYDASTCGGKFSTSPVDGYIPYPCGLLPYSFFNDQFNMTISNHDRDTSFVLGSSYSTGSITWQNEIDKYTIRRVSARETRMIKRDNKIIMLPLLKDPFIQNWLKPAAHSTFRKLYKLLNISLNAGDNITLFIDNKFIHPVADGQKWIVLSTLSWMGAQNRAIAWIYAFVAGTLSFTAIFLIITHRYKFRSSK